MLLRRKNGTFAKGNNSGKRFSKEYSPYNHPNNKKTRFCAGEMHPNWKGDNVGRTAIHEFVGKYLGKANCCWNLDCPDKSKTFDWANLKNHIYRRKLSDFAMLCRSCHIKFDRGLCNIRIKDEFSR